MNVTDLQEAPPLIKDPVIRAWDIGPCPPDWYDPAPHRRVPDEYRLPRRKRA